MWFPIFVVLLCLKLITKANLSFRSTPKALGVFFADFEALKDRQLPSSKTVQRWLATVGLYKLKSPKEIADDWILILDCSIQQGVSKCLTVMGAQRSKLPLGRSLTLKDFQLIDIQILDQVNGKIIKSLLKDIEKSLGSIEAICSDEGSDILSGIKMFQKENPKTIHIPDVAHKMANLLKAFQKNDSKWLEFCARASKCKAQLQQTEAAALIPPSQRSKARFMNIDTLVDWGVSMLAILDNPEKLKGIVEWQFFKESLGWINEYRSTVSLYANLVEATKLTRHYVRNNGISKTMTEQLERELENLPLQTIGECQFIGEILNFLRDQLAKIEGKKEGFFVLGSSEVIESFFGKLKSMEKEQCRFGFTRLVLAAHAAIGNIEEKTVIQALAKIKSKDLDEWIEKQIGGTVQSRRKKIMDLSRGILKARDGLKLSGNTEGERVAA